MALALDGKASNNQDTTSFVVITTTQSNDILFLTSNVSTGPLTSVSDSAGLNWQRYFTFESPGNYMDVWYAVAPSPLVSDTITPVGSIYELQSFAISGANTSNPFNVPYVTQANTASPVVISPVSSAMVVGFANQTTQEFPTSGSGFNLIFGEGWQLSEYALTGAGNVTVGSGQQSDTHAMAAMAISPLTPSLNPLPPWQLITSAGTVGPVILDEQAVPFEVAVALEVPAGVSISAQVQFTLDDILASSASSFAAQAFDPSQVGWTPVWQNGGTSTASTVWVFSANSQTTPGPVRAVQIDVTSLTGTAMAAVLQSVPQRIG